MNLLLVEDEVRLADSLARFLEDEGGFHVKRAGTCEEANSALDAATKLVILDWGLPDGSGIRLLRNWRKRDLQVPVIFLTARSELVDKITGLEGGASDFLTKPFEPRELLARIRAQLRLNQAAETQLRYADITMDLQTRDVFHRARRVSLVKMEHELLRRLMESPEKVFSRAELLDEVWGYENYPTTRTVDFHIAQLRAKFAPGLFETVRGIGYRLTAGEEIS